MIEVGVSMNLWDEIPMSIRKHIKNSLYEKDDLGMGESRVYLFKDDHLVLKIIDDVNQAKHEIDAITWLNQNNHCVPRSVAHEMTQTKGYLLMTMMEGKMAIDSNLIKDDPEGVIRALANGLKYLWRIPIDKCPLDMRINHKLDIAKSRILNHKVDMSDWDEAIIKNRFTDLNALYQYLIANKKEEDLVFSHGDYCLPNVFIEDGEIKGFIDLGLAGVADRHVDIALCLRSIKFNFNTDRYNDLFISLLDIEVDFEKIDYYLLLDELF